MPNTSYDNPSQVFEITDYTTASDWERFISNLEDILTQWNLNNQSTRCSNEQHRPLQPGAISRGRWYERSDTINFGEYPFDLKYKWLDESQDDLYLSTKDACSSQASHSAGDNSSEKSGSDLDSDEFQDCEDNTDLGVMDLQEEEKRYTDQELPTDLPVTLNDLLDTKNDFSSRVHCLVRWYNQRKFLTITPKDDYIIANEDRVKLLLGSASIALANIDCLVPIFVQIRHPRSNFFLGTSEHNNIRTMYEMVYFRQSSEKYQYLSELINMFREKIDCTLNDLITATIRLNYCLESFTMDTFEPEYKELASMDVAFSRTWQTELSNLVNSVKKATESLSPLARERKFYAQFQVALKQLTQNQDSLNILKYIHVSALWPPLSDKVISDTQVHTDLNPAEAPIWTMRVVSCDSYPNSIASVVAELLDFSIQQADNSILDVIRAILVVSCNVINEKFKNILSELNEDEVVGLKHEYLEMERLEEKLQKKEFKSIHNILSRYEKQLCQIQAVSDLFSKAIKYVYETIDGAKELDCTTGELEYKCKVMSYKLSVQPETILSDDPSDDMRRLVVILFERQKYCRERSVSSSLHCEMTDQQQDKQHDLDDSAKFKDHIIERSYRNFGLDNKPTVKEFILRSNVSRPFSSGITAALPQRMFCTISDDEFRLCGAFSELTN